jgi:hypothetical protein
MNNTMVEFCAKVLWEKSQQDLANQSRYRHLAKKPGKPISWAEINDPDIIPSVADQYRENVKLMAVTMRRWIAANSKDDSGMLDLFISATDSNEDMMNV